MKANFRLVRLLVLAAVFAAAGLGVPGTSSSSTGTTLDNLMAAYNGESNAHAKYLEYAKKADQEGYLRELADLNIPSKVE